MVYVFSGFQARGLKKNIFLVIRVFNQGSNSFRILDLYSLYTCKYTDNVRVYLQHWLSSFHKYLYLSPFIILNQFQIRHRMQRTNIRITDLRYCVGCRRTRRKRWRWRNRRRIFYYGNLGWHIFLNIS